MHAKPSSWFPPLSPIRVEEIDYLYTHSPCHCTHRLHHILAPCPWLHALTRVTTTPCVYLKPTPLPIFAMAPCHIPLSLSTIMSQGITPMTPHSFTRHCALMYSILHHVLSWLHCRCILMLHLSNRVGNYVHGLSIYLTQGIAPLCHYRERSLHHVPCWCDTPPHVMKPLCGC